MNEIIDTPTAAQELGMSHAALRNWLSRNPSFRPARQVGFNFVWTREEIEAVKQRRIELRSRSHKEQA